MREISAEEWRDCTVTFYDDEQPIRYVQPRRPYKAVIALLAATNIAAFIALGVLL